MAEKALDSLGIVAYNIHTMNKHQTGTVSELLIASYFVQNGYAVSKPITDFGEYDLVVDNGVLSRVQVKTVYWDNSKNRYLISCVTSHIKGSGRRTNKKYSQESFDLLAAVETETMAVYLIPISDIAGRRSITLYPKGKPKTVVNRYEDFEQYRV